MGKRKTSTVPFQLMPDLPTWEFESLKESIRKYGVIIPIVKDETGAILDGHHREKACQELGIKNIPTITLAGLTDDEKRDHALILNLVRRKITRKQLRSIIATELRRSPELSNRWLAEIVGTTNKTVESVRRDLLCIGEIPQCETYRTKDGRNYPATRIYTERTTQTDRARVALETLGETAPRKSVTLKQLEREAKEKERSSTQRVKYQKPREQAQIRLYHSTFQKLEDTASIEPGSVDLVLTDVPYAREFAPQFDELANFAARILKDGGIFAVYLGVVQVADAIMSLSKCLDYRATAFSSWLGDGPVLQHLQCVTQSTPILVFSKGRWTRTTRWYNVFHNETCEQDQHKWQKPLGDVEHWIHSFSNPGEVVCDPCAGSGTTALACHRLGRKFVGGDCDRDAIRVAQTRLRNAELAKEMEVTMSLGKALTRTNK